ncbi:MAG: transglycosylase domain-containing protein [Mucilaginibacter sp.]
MAKFFLMHRIPLKYIRIAGIVTATLLVIMLIGGAVAYSKREALLQSAIAKIKAKAKTEYNLDVQIGSARFTGLATVAFDGITVVPQNRDSLLSIKKFDVGVKIFPLIFGNVKLAELNMADGHLNLTDINGVKNFDFLFKKKKDTTTQKSKVDLAELANNLIKQVLYKIPDNMQVNNFLISYKGDTTGVKLLTQKAVIDGGDLTSTIKVDDGAATWHFAGTMYPSDKEIDVKWYADGKKVELPLIQQKFKLKLNFDQLTIKLNDVKHSDGETRVESYVGVSNLLINHKALSSSDMVVPNGAIEANLVVGSNYVSVDSSSVIHLKKLTAHPYLKYTLSPSKIYELKLNTGWLPAQDVFDSFPSGMFDSFQGIQVAGNLNYSFNLYLDSAHPDDVQFDSSLSKDDFRIIKYGKANLSKLNSSFIYTPYKKGKPLPSRVIGPENPDYATLNEISPDLRNAVMTAEDPTFYKNHGFVEEALRKSLATDFKEKKFKRGGSTISMQLVKNTFLSQEKTLARKIEEILIVWMIENNNIMTKARMLEVYFNIVEWGPNIYGIRQAANYYFGVSPAELTLGQSIYLASIVPKPSTGLYAFLTDGSLRPGLVNYFNSLGRLMAGQYLTKPDTSTAYGFYGVRLKESLRREVAPVDSVTASQMLKATDADDDIIPLLNVEPDRPKPTFLQRLFGKKDTVAQKIDQKLKEEVKRKVDNIDTTGKTKKQIRQEKREIKRQEKEKRQELKDKGIL